MRHTLYKFLFLIAPVLCIALLLLVSRNRCTAQTIPVIPYPVNVSLKTGDFEFSKTITIQYSDFDMGRTSHYVQEELMRRFGQFGKIEKDNSSDIRLTLDALGDTSESYQITIGNHILLSGSRTGLFYSAQTLFQLIEGSNDGKGQISIPKMTISDQPHFGWRGVMLDESRHFFGKDVVKSLLRWMAYYKLNVFHWHLTDSPGWRLEIASYPDLALIGGIGDHHNPKLRAQYYTQEDVREIVRFAEDLHITVVPEIDMPGHATAVNKAYPVFSGGGSDRYPEWTMHPIKDTVVRFLTDVLQEVDALFPSQMIHLGGDEVHFGNDAWNSDPLIIDWMKKNDKNSLVDVEHYFINRMADTIIGINNMVLGWDEIVDAGLPAEQLIVFWWRHDKAETLSRALEGGYSVILCPRIPMYFDFVQLESHTDGRKWSGQYADLQSVYEFPPDTLYNKSFDTQILGVQANLWTEQIANRNRLTYLTFPRIAALAESGWVNPVSKDYGAFQERIRFHNEQYAAEHLYFFNVFDPQSSPEPPLLESER